MLTSNLVLATNCSCLKYLKKVFSALIINHWSTNQNRGTNFIMNHENQPELIDKENDWLYDIIASIINQNFKLSPNKNLNNFF